MKNFSVVYVNVRCLLYRVVFKRGIHDSVFFLNDILERLVHFVFLPRKINKIHNTYNFGDLNFPVSISNLDETEQNLDFLLHYYTHIYSYASNVFIAKIWVRIYWTKF